MNDLILKARHWQIFMVAVGLPLIIEFVSTPFIVMSDNPFALMKIFPLIMLLLIGGFFSWFWAIAIGLQRVLPEELKLPITRFKVFLFIPLIYMIFLVGVFMFLFGVDGANPAVFAIIFPLHFFSMFCVFYCLYFAAKVFKTAELQRNVTFSDFAGEFFLIWFFPIGVWIVQPRINKMYAEALAKSEEATQPQ